MYFPLYELFRNFHVVSVNFFIEQHGKNDCDGHFSKISFWLQNKSFSHPILNTNDVVLAIKEGSKTANDRRVQSGKDAILCLPINIDNIEIPEQQKIAKIEQIKSFYCYERIFEEKKEKDKEDEIFTRIKLQTQDTNYKIQKLRLGTVSVVKHKIEKPRQITPLNYNELKRKHNVQEKMFH